MGAKNDRLLINLLLLNPLLSVERVEWDDAWEWLDWGASRSARKLPLLLLPKQRIMNDMS